MGLHLYFFFLTLLWTHDFFQFLESFLYTLNAYVLIIIILLLRAYNSVSLGVLKYSFVTNRSIISEFENHSSRTVDVL